MKILITAPSLETRQNVSGISSVVAQIIKHGSGEFVHFRAGRWDNEKRGNLWVLKQVFLVIRFAWKLRKGKFDVLHLNTALDPYAVARDMILAETAKILRCPILLHIHGGKFMAREFDNELFEKFAKKLKRRASIVAVLSESEKELVTKRWQHIDVRVLENAVALDEVQTRKPETSEKTIIFLGRIHEDKGLREIIEACGILKSEGFRFRFKCFGAGEAKDHFVTEMTNILGEKFLYGGVVSGAKKWKALSESDIFLLPSRYEGLPVALLEAMAAGCVPVASDVGSIGLVVKDTVNGSLIEPGNVSQMIEKLKPLLSADADLESLRRNARQRIEEKFDFKDYIKKLEDIYAEIAI